MTPRSRPGPDLATGLKRLYKLGSLARHIVFNWCHTQGASLGDQLSAGIRYLDLRLCFDLKSESFWLTHGLLAGSFSRALEEIKGFVSTHDGEVVLLDFNHFYAMQEKQHQAAVDMIYGALKPWVCPSPKKDNAQLPSLKECKENNYRVIVFYHSPEGLSLSHGAFWGGSYIPSPWPNVIHKDRLFEFLEAKYLAGRDDKKFYVTQSILTPTATFIVFHVFRSLRYLAKSVNPRFVRWLDDKKSGPQGINVCIVDFSVHLNYIGVVIALNK